MTLLQRKRKQFVFKCLILFIAALITISCAVQEDTSKDSDNESGNNSVGDITAPAEVSNFTVTVSNKAAQLQWVEPVDADFTNVEIVYGRTNVIGGDQKILVNKGTMQNLIGSLENERSYTFIIRTVDSSGNKSAGIVKTDIVHGVRPNNVLNFRVTSYTADKIYLAWDNPAVVNYYQVWIHYITGNVDGSCGTFHYNNSYTLDYGITSGATVVLSVRTSDIDWNCSDSYGMTIITNTAAPANVSGLTSITGITQEITLNWNAPADADYSHVEISYVKSGITNTVKVYKGTNSARITGLSNGTSYTFTVKSVDTLGYKSNGVAITALCSGS